MLGTLVLDPGTTGTSMASALHCNCRKGFQAMEILTRSDPGILWYFVSVPHWIAVIVLGSAPCETCPFQAVISRLPQPSICLKTHYEPVSVGSRGPEELLVSFPELPTLEQGRRVSSSVTVPGWNNEARCIALSVNVFGKIYGNSHFRVSSPVTRNAHLLFLIILFPLRSGCICAWRAVSNN